MKTIEQMKAFLKMAGYISVDDWTFEELKDYAKADRYYWYEDQQMFIRKQPQN